MSEQRKRSSVGFWTTVILLLPVMYVASFGPACWITSYVARKATVVDFVYQPLMRLWWGEDESGGRHARTMLYRFGCLFADPDWRFSGIYSSEVPENDFIRYEFWDGT